jgi:hypothetical protein
VDHGFFLILDLAIGGGYPNGVCGCTSPSSFTSSGGTTGSTQFDARVASGAGGNPPFVSLHYVSFPAT